jgi:hypothetical protein
MARQGGRLRVRLIGRRGEGMAARARGPGLRCGRREEMYRYTLDAYRERQGRAGKIRDPVRNSKMGP